MRYDIDYGILTSTLGTAHASQWELLLSVRAYPVFDVIPRRLGVTAEKYPVHFVVTLGYTLNTREYKSNKREYK